MIFYKNNQQMRKNWILISLLNFLIAAIMGLVLRAAFVWELNWIEFKNLLHGHSHVALLGWLYLGFFILIHGNFLPKEKASKPIYSYLFWLTQFSITGMMIAFPLQGYAGFSIFYSSLHIVLSYLFVFRVWRDHIKGCEQINLLLKTSLFLLLLSTLGVWGVAVIMGNGGGGGMLYQVAIQFYLHFQFNGWLIFALLTLIVKTFKVGFPRLGFRLVYGFLLLSQILTFALILFWAYQWSWAYYVNAVGVLLQLFGLVAIFVLKRKSLPKLSLHFSPKTKPWLILAVIVGLIRVAAQTLLVLPELAEMAVILRLFIIGFIHLSMLGLFSAYLMFSFINSNTLEVQNRGMKTAVWFYYLGFIGTEMLLFAQGFFFWQGWGSMAYFNESLLVFSCCLPLGICIYIHLFNKHPNSALLINYT